ncbi:acetate--CoA ligase family protein [Arthrobacter sp. 08Y14]|uniref:acetate--CoA ligase family protein n=1 Tax=Arthrobacter sp. 08Y14 TaxID=2058885 RepID=UPI000CE365CA|nr:CoA-binding protein [Arthrobacter sp. 08Y14]
MSPALAELLFNPRSVVVYGASADPDKLSGRPLAYLLSFGFEGSVYAVNPRRSEVQGVPSYPDVASIGEPVDLAVIVVPAPAVPDAVRRCGQAGVGAAIVFASGFAEAEDGQDLQTELADAVRETGIRLLGPNCLGAFSAANNVYSTFSTAFDAEGDRPYAPIALVSQSGAVGTFTYTTMVANGLGLRHYANTGNEIDVTAVEILDALADDDAVEVLMGHLEGVRDLAALRSLVSKAARKDKPLLFLKSGRTEAGARAVRRHTASIAGDDAAFDQVLAAGKAVRVESMQEWADAALLFADGRRMAGPRLSILTLSGGSGALAADRAVLEGLRVDPWSEAEDHRALREVLPSFASTANPIDMTGAMINDLSLLDRGLSVTSANAQTDAILVILGNADKDAEKIVERLVAAHRASTKPFAVVWTGGSGRPLRALLEAGVPAYPEPDRAVRVLAHLHHHSSAG